MNTHLSATVYLIKAWLDDHRRVSDRGAAITVEMVLWAVAIVLLVGAVVAVLNGYVQGQLAKLS